MAVYNVTSAVTGTLSVTESFSTLVDENWLKRKACVCVCACVRACVCVSTIAGGLPSCLY